MYKVTQEGGGVCGLNMSCNVQDRHSLPLTGNPDTTELRWKDGQSIQGRTYDSEGNPSVDTDLTDHGNPTYPAPHTHEWNENPDGSFSRQGGHNPL